MNNTKAASEAALAINKTLAKLDREDRLAAMHVVEVEQGKIAKSENCEIGNHDWMFAARGIPHRCMHCGVVRQ